MKVEVQDDKSGFRFRLVAEDGRASGWAGYTQIAMLDDKAAITGYYAGAAEFELTPLDPKTVLQQFAVCETIYVSPAAFERINEILEEDKTAEPSPALLNLLNPASKEL